MCLPRPFQQLASLLLLSPRLSGTFASRCVVMCVLEIRCPRPSNEQHQGSGGLPTPRIPRHPPPRVWSFATNGVGAAGRSRGAGGIPPEHCYWRSDMDERMWGPQAGSTGSWAAEAKAKAACAKSKAKGKAKAKASQYCIGDVLQVWAGPLNSSPGLLGPELAPDCPEHGSKTRCWPGVPNVRPARSVFRSCLRQLGFQSGPTRAHDY